jgi:hypothetical protein
MSGTRESAMAPRKFSVMCIWSVDTHRYSGYRFASERAKREIASVKSEGKGTAIKVRIVDAMILPDSQTVQIALPPCRIIRYDLPSMKIQT